MDQTLTKWKTKSFPDLAKLIGKSFSDQATGEDGLTYIVDSSLNWQDGEKKQIVIDVMVATAGVGPLRRIDRSIVVHKK